jgi:hypothetical protein
MSPRSGLRRHRALAAGGAAPRPSFQLERFSARNHGTPITGSFGAASKPRILNAAERKEIEARLRAEGRLQ